MKSVWPWVIGIAVGLMILALLAFGSSDRQDYWVARGTVARPVQVTHVEDLTLIRFPCGDREGTIESAGGCSFYVWKR